MNRFISIIVLTGVSAGVLWAQLAVDVALVDVVATVLDERGRYVADLTEDDFLVHEDGEPQPIRHFSRSNDLPVSVGVVLDTSGSMDRKIDTATAAVDRFFRQIHPDDEIFLVTFDNSARLVEDFTDDRSRLAAALRRVRVGGGTALYDALILGLEHVRNGRHEKKAILVISDGEDTGSARSLESAQRFVRESETLVYSLGIAPEAFGVTPTPPTFPTGRPTGRVGIPFPGGTPPTFPRTGGGPVGIPFPGGGPGGRRTPPRTPPAIPTAPADVLNMEVLELFAEISGGRTWMVSGWSDSGRENRISEALDVLAEELRSQYTIGYYPAHSPDDGRWHTVEITTRYPGYRVRHREQYFGGRAVE